MMTGVNHSFPESIQQFFTRKTGKSWKETLNAAIFSNYNFKKIFY